MCKSSYNNNLSKLRNEMSLLAVNRNTKKQIMPNPDIDYNSVQLMKTNKWLNILYRVRDGN